MIIDTHCHYTTEPFALHTFRDKQFAGLADIFEDNARRVFPRLDARLISRGHQGRQGN